MQPITYSLILNLAVLACLTGVTIHFNQPWLALLLVVALVLQTHALQRFSEESRHDDDLEDEGRPIGFTANIG